MATRLLKLSLRKYKKRCSYKKYCAAVVKEEKVCKKKNQLSMSYESQSESSYAGLSDMMPKVNVRNRTFQE